MLRPTFLGFNIAKRGIAASQKGLDITGQNMTNWDSNGYTRQRVDQVAISPSIYTTRFATNRIGVTGQGVDIPGIAQIRDSFLDKRYRDECSDMSYFNSATNVLNDIESAIGEFQPEFDTGIRGCLNTLLPALLTFSELPYSETNANIIATEFRNLTQTLHHLNSKLDSVANQQKYNLETSVNDLNKKLQDLAAVNYAISQDLGLTLDDKPYGPNELFDQRNLLLDQIAEYGEIEVTEHSNRTITVSMGGMTVVDGDKYEKMQMVRNSNETVTLRWVSTGEAIRTETGGLKGLTDFINGRGANVVEAGESQYRGIPYYRDQLNTFANTLAGVVNNIIPEFDASGNITGYKELLGGLSATPDSNGKYPVTTGVQITAENIAISDLWTEDSAYVIAKSDNKDNNYILDLYNALAIKESTFVSNGEIFKGNFYEFVDNYASTLAEDITFYNGRQMASSSIVSELQNRRDEVSGVVLDEEVTNMMMYNKSYQAASRLMTTLDEALDVLINKMGLVGR